MTAGERPASDGPDPQSADAGLSWSWGLDFETLLNALTTPAAWERSPAADPAPADPAPADPDSVDRASDDDASADVDQAEADLAEYLDVVAAGRSRVVPLEVVAGRVAESLPAGPDLAGWLATSSVQGLENGALAGMAASYRRLAAWAQAGELAVVAELASRSAAADDTIGVDEHGRPLRLPEEACAQVSLALTMSHASAAWWSDLGVTLAWRLTATGAALRAGEIDLGRARLIAEATAALDEETARAVEARVLPRAGGQTTGQLRAALRRAVIAADPEGAERRREEAERRAKVAMYPDAEGTAALAGYSLPGIRAAAAMARITALARAMKASGAGGSIDLLRAQVFLGLLLGTLPVIPPAPDGPPDEDAPSDDDPPRGDAPGGDDLPRGDPPGDHDPLHREPPDDDPSCDDQRYDDQPYDSDDDRPYDDPLDDSDDDLWPNSRPPPAWPPVPAFLPAGPAAMGNLPPAGGGLLDLRVPWATLTGESGEPGYVSRLGPVTPAQARFLADLATHDGAVPWRVIVTGPDGRVHAVSRVPRPVATQARAGPVGRITVTIGRDALASAPAGDLPVTLARIRDEAVRASERADKQAAADLVAAGGCAHEAASPAYRPPVRLWEYVTARDLTCRFPTCRQPAWRCDLDHTTPYEQGGRTCSCNLGGLCRFHHQLKQHLRWHLAQCVPGTFTWTTPAGRRYVVEPDLHLMSAGVIGTNDGLG